MYDYDPHELKGSHFFGLILVDVDSKTQLSLSPEGLAALHEHGLEGFLALLGDEAKELIIIRGDYLNA